MKERLLHLSKKHLILAALLGVCAALTFAAISTSPVSSQPAADRALKDNGSKYIGASKCKRCHATEEGNPYDTWKSMKHAGAYDALNTPEAAELGKAHGVDDVFTEACVSCHVTGYGLDSKRFAKSFKERDGVQCESCHGPGGDHMEARMAAADEGAPQIGEGEIIRNPTVAVCLSCHNKKSPSFKAFDCEERLGKIIHFKPGNEHLKAERVKEFCKK